MQEAEKLLDLLSATGNDIEQTRAGATTRTALYANVCALFEEIDILVDTRFSIFLLPRSWPALKQENSTRVTLMLTNTII